MLSRIVVAFFAVLSILSMALSIVTADDAPSTNIPVTDDQKTKLQSDPFIKKVESTFEAEMKTAETAYANAARKAKEKRIAAYRDQLKAFTKAGEFDKAVACKAVLSELEKGDADSPPNTKEIKNSIGMKFRLIPPGEFLMGSPDGEVGREAHEGPQHKVMISKPLYMGVTEVTQEEFVKVMGINPSENKGAQNPVEKVNWEEAVEFCRKLSVSQKEKAAGRVYRLPTEAEWEYACRAGMKNVYSFGDDARRLGEYAWFESNSEGKTHPVGKLKPNAFGLFDLHGNVWEWCGDWNGGYPTGLVTDPTGPASGSTRVCRGGSWNLNALYARCSVRGLNDPSGRGGNVGFRVIVEL